MKHHIRRKFLKPIVWLFIALIMLLLGSISVLASNFRAEVVKLNKHNREQAAVFSVDNMFPGDEVTRDFAIEVSHKEPLQLFFQTKLQDESEKLAEVLQIKVELPKKEQLLYEGLFKDMTEPVVSKLAGGEIEAVYRITVYLDTSVGNEYQNKTLSADFYWWYMEEQEGEEDDDADDFSENIVPADKIESPQTGDHSKAELYFILSVLSVLGVLVLKQKKEE